METCRNQCVYLYVEVHKHSHNRAGRVAGSSIYSLVNVGMHYVTTLIMMNLPHRKRIGFKTNEKVVFVSYCSCNK